MVAEEQGILIRGKNYAPFFANNVRENGAFEENCYWTYFVITPQAMRSPEFPDGSVRISSGLA